MAGLRGWRAETKLTAIRAIILPVADLKPDERIKAVYHF